MLFLAVSQVVTKEKSKLELLGQQQVADMNEGRVLNTALVQVMTRVSPTLAVALVRLMEWFSLLYVIDNTSSLVPPLLPEASASTGLRHLEVGFSLLREQ